MKRSNLLIVLLVSVVLLAAGCAYQPDIAPTPIPTLPPATLPAEVFSRPTAAQVPAVGTPESGAPSSTEDLVAAGSQVFEQSCAVCHNLTDEAKVGPGLAGLFDRDQLPNGEPVTDENLAGWITTGGGAMPGLPLTQEQLSAVVAFLNEATQQ